MCERACAGLLSHIVTRHGLGSVIDAGLAAALGDALGRPIESARRAAGGSIAESYAVTLEGGERAFVKTHATLPAAAFLREAEGLAYLAETRTVRVPSRARDGRARRPRVPRARAAEDRRLVVRPTRRSLRAQPGAPPRDERAPLRPRGAQPPGDAPGFSSKVLGLAREGRRLQPAVMPVFTNPGFTQTVRSPRRAELVVEALEVVRQPGLRRAVEDHRLARRGRPPTLLNTHSVPPPRASRRRPRLLAEEHRVGEVDGHEQALRQRSRSASSWSCVANSAAVTTTVSKPPSASIGGVERRGEALRAARSQRRMTDAPRSPRPRACRSAALRARSSRSRPSRNSDHRAPPCRRASARPMPLVAPRKTTFMCLLARARAHLRAGRRGPAPTAPTGSIAAGSQRSRTA
jgi:hypothetical protein